jgi:hypothetical protein
MDTRTLERRVRNLETRCARLQAVAIAAGAVSAGACLAAFHAPAESVVRAERFELVNGAGEVRGRLEMHGQTPRLVLESPENGSLAGLSAGPSAREPREGDRPLHVRAVGDPSEPAMATLILSGVNPEGRHLWTELQVRPYGNTLFMNSTGPTVLLAADVPQESRARTFLHMCAESEAAEGPFGHATFGATERGGYTQLGADDLDLVQIDAEGPVLMELRDREQKTLFQAP